MSPWYVLLYVHENNRLICAARHISEMCGYHELTHISALYAEDAENKQLTGENRAEIVGARVFECSKLFCEVECLADSADIVTL